MPLLSKLLAGQRRIKVAKHIRGDVLELGCGTAQVLENYSSKISSYCGIEKSNLRVEKLIQQYPNASFYRRDLDRDRLEINRKFDCILMVAVIEHLFNQQFVIAEVAKVLKTGGIVVITTPTPFGNDVIHPLGAILGLTYKSAVNDHIVIYNRHRFKILANEVGLRLKYHSYFQFYCNQIAVLEKLGDQLSV